MSKACGTRSGRPWIAFVPYLAQDVYDFDALHEIGRLLFEPTTISDS